MLADLKEITSQLFRNIFLITGLKLA